MLLEVFLLTVEMLCPSPPPYSLSMMPWCRGRVGRSPAWRHFPGQTECPSPWPWLWSVGGSPPRGVWSTRTYHLTERSTRPVLSDVFPWLLDTDPSLFYTALRYFLHASGIHPFPSPLVLYKASSEIRHCNASQNTACVVLVSPTGAGGQSQTPPSFLMRQAWRRSQTSRPFRLCP